MGSNPKKSVVGRKQSIQQSAVQNTPSIWLDKREDGPAGVRPDSIRPSVPTVPRAGGAVRTARQSHQPEGTLKCIFPDLSTACLCAEYDEDVPGGTMSKQVRGQRLALDQSCTDLIVAQRAAQDQYDSVVANLASFFHGPGTCSATVVGTDVCMPGTAPPSVTSTTVTTVSVTTQYVPPTIPYLGTPAPKSAKRGCARVGCVCVCVCVFTGEGKQR